VTDHAPGPGDWLAYVLSEFLEFSGEAMRMLAEDADPSDRRMLARRLAEYEIACEDELTPDEIPGPAPGGVWECQDSWGRTETELQNAELDWLHRYDARPATSRERRLAGLMLDDLLVPDESLLGAAGIDGTIYALARREHGPGGPAPVLLTVTDAGIIEVVTGFRDWPHRAEWLADREHGLRPSADGFPPPVLPMAQDAAGPDCLARAEERVLAWLLADPPAARGPAARLEAHAFSSHARAEIFEAWRSAIAGEESPSPGTVRHELARRLLRAPAWADRSIGWPFGYIGLTYFDRLSATPASAGQAMPAIDLIALEVVIAREADPVAAPSVAADPRSYLGRAAARGIQLPGFQPPGGP